MPGYRVSYFVDGDDGHDAPLQPPDYVFCDATLDESLARIRDFLRTWIEAGSSDGACDGPARAFHISLIGPFPDDLCIVDRRSPEQRLADAVSPEERVDALADVAKSQFDAGHFEEARQHIFELQTMLPSIEGNWDYPSAAATVEIVLGRLALQGGDIEGSKRHLIGAASGRTSATMSSFGPNMSLARDLLVAGEKQAVLDYFEACSEFWESGAARLDEWAMYVNAGRIPDFGANLDY